MQKKLKKVAVTIGFKADNTPIKKAFYGRSTAQAKSRAERWLESHGTPEKQADILTLGGWAARWLNVYKKPDVTPTAYTTTYEITVRRHILPALGNEFVTVIKESSIVSVIGIADLMFRTNDVIAVTYKNLECLAVAALCYFVLTFVSGRAVSLAERKLSHGK